MALVGARSLLGPGHRAAYGDAGLGLLFLLFGFAFTNAAAWVEDQSTVNRATLHLHRCGGLDAARLSGLGGRLAAKPGDATAVRLRRRA